MINQQSEYLEMNQDLTDSAFNKIRQIVYERSGISLGDNKQALVRARIAKRMRKLDITAYDDYINYVLNDTVGVELEYMLDAISTNTTHFYREESHFDLMRNILRHWINDGLRRLRIWCAASSTGEEPYTLAIEILESVQHKQIDAKILATDIAPSVLKTAMAGVYSEERVASIPGHLRSHYFDRVKMNGKCEYKAKPVLKNLLLFRQMNLSVTPYPLKNPVDMIFCRNVMIYFDRSLRTELVNEFRRIIRPGGYLFVGHAESITAYSKGFKCVRPSVYIRV
ncbi:MAG: chemotaxis protein CheR [Candidatus Zixiibacteriota bacterium]|nr:MAG: chemotaxis protein CheR [candidate division Zixibacteria bacterium]HHI02253.1 protein-glutamate O-methyltransferase CheR [candidate division Zixibacteria bacterium]